MIVSYGETTYTTALTLENNVFLSDILICWKYILKQFKAKNNAALLTESKCLAPVFIQTIVKYTIFLSAEDTFRRLAIVFRNILGAKKSKANCILLQTFHWFIEEYLT